MTQLILPGFENFVLNNLKDSWEAPWLKQDMQIELPGFTDNRCWLHAIALCRICQAKGLKPQEKT